MRKITRTFALISAIAMLLTAESCSFRGKDGDSKNVHKGGYVEETVDLGINISQDNEMPVLSEFAKSNDGTAFFNMQNSTLYSLKDGGDKFDGEIAGIIKDKVPIQNSFSSAVSPEGDYYFCRYDSRSDGYSGVYVSSDGSQHKTDSDEMITSAEFTADNRLFAAADGHVYEISTANYSLKAVFDTGYTIKAFDIIGDNIIVVDENGVKMYDYKNSSEIQTPEVLNNFFKNFSGSEYGLFTCYDICSDDNNNMYILTTDGIFRYASNGNQIEKIIDGTKYQIGNPENKVNSLTYCDDGTFYVSFTSGLMVKYRYDQELRNEKTSVLKIYSLEKNDTLSQAIRDFSSDNTNTEIDYQIGMRSGLTYEDAMKNLTTQILSGSSPDVILLDGMDIDNFIDKNLLMDLSDYEDQWNKESQLLDNIVKWDNRSGEIYSVTCKFRIPAVAGAQKELEKIKDYSDIADYVEKTRKESQPQEAVLFMLDAGMVIRNALIFEGKELVTENDIDRDKLEKFYSDCARVYKNDQPEGMIYSSCDNFDPDNEYFFNLTSALVTPNALALGALSSFEDDVNCAASIDTYRNNKDVSFRYGLSPGSRSFIPECNLGIIENGKNHKEAVKFIAQALDSETQKINYSDGLPVNTDTLDYIYKKNQNPFDYKTTVLDSKTNKTYDWDIYWMSDEEAEEFDSYIRSLNDPLYIDRVTRDIIVDEGIKCAEGSITAQVAADDALSQLKLKMKE